MLVRFARPFVFALLLAVPGGPLVASAAAQIPVDAADPGAGSSSPAPGIELPDDPGIAGSPAALVPLYISFATLQILDAHSTTRALRAGHVEANPVMAPLAGNPAAFFGVKAATAAGTIYFAERIRKRNRAAAIVLMVGLNAATAAIVAHNYRLK